MKQILDFLSRRAKMNGKVILKSSKFVSFGIQREAVWSKAEWPDLGPKWVRLTPNRTNLGHFQIRFHYTLTRRAKMY